MKIMTTARMVATIALMVLVLTGCKEAGMSATEQQERVRGEIMERANASVPVPQINNFSVRESVAEYMRRMDDPNKIFYLYIVADTGNIIGYHVSQGAPVNICTFMTPPDRIDDRVYGQPDNQLRAAPAIDGVYYGGGACETEYFFDAETGALIQIQGNNLIVSDQPLDVDAQPISVAEGGE